MKKELKKWELIKEAYDRFPKGVKASFKSAPNVSHVSTGKFEIREDDDSGIYITSDVGTECFFCEKDEGVYSPEWAEIIPAEPEKAGLLDGKCAIQVNNEREFKLLMEHMHAKGWTWSGKSPCTPISALTHAQVGRLEYKTEVMYKDNFLFNPADDDWKIIPFADFAAEVGIEVPLFLMKSQDGFDLYKNDQVFYASIKDVNSDWYLCQGRNSNLSYNISKLSDAITCPERNKAFHSKEAAEAFILEANKPKEIEIPLSNTASISVKSDRIICNGSVSVISREMMLDIVKMQESL